MRYVTSRAILAAVLALVAIAAAACGSSAAKTASPAAGGSSTAAIGTPGHGGFGDRTARPEIQTSIAQGTPFAGNRTPRPEIQTSIAEGTPFAAFGDRTPSPDEATAIAQGTPVRDRGGPGGRSRTLTEVAAILAIDEGQLRTELQAAGATIASVAAAHGLDRPTIRQALIVAEEQRLADSVTNGSITQAMADDQTSQLEARVDQILDGNGGGVPPPPAP